MSNELQRADKGFVGVLRSLGMSSTDRANQINRSVNEYQPCSVDAFFEPDRGVYNSIVSGGDNRIRTNAMVAQTVCALHPRKFVRNRGVSRVPILRIKIICTVQ